MIFARTVLAMMLASAAAAGCPIAAAQSADVVGVYDGGQTEMAVGIELHADGRFLYGMSYGALDEQAQGTWTSDGSQVLLTSDPVVPPRFVLTDLRDAPAGQIKLLLDLPEGMSRQYFNAEFRLPDGSVIDRQLSDEPEPLEFDARAMPVSVTLRLPVFDLRGETIALPPPMGHEIHVRFEPHDLGVVAFARTPLRRDHGDLILQRYDRTIRFRRVAAAESPR
ncbi:hypothetical protein EDF56_1088 [Novosphingobium sp. PhB165]|uniref:hypothetical protein n=1 Tax=Novosphingobium sp. PhB165 TaxID=2485105 RepID=UPI001053B382|nr:hypothetical protein [Novosphingobium sp. PhB165]TCM16020.1 hypothetical protein EDF56_1088 [Novosphingobium sp. PhB165]